MGSTRLPGKVLLPIAGRELISHVVGRASVVHNDAKVVVATSGTMRDDAIVEWCERSQTRFFRGSEQDVLERYFRCAREHALDPIVRLTADNPFTDIEELDRLIAQHRIEGNDFSHSLPSLPVGVGAEIFTFAALERSHHEARGAHHREHVDEYMIENPNLFRTGVLEVPASKHRPDLRLTVDTEADYRRACFIAENGRGLWVSTEEAIALCTRFA